MDRKIRTDQEWIEYFDRQKESQRKWRSRNPQKVKDAHDRWTEKNQDKVKTYRQNYNKRRWTEIKAAKKILKERGMI